MTEGKKSEAPLPPTFEEHPPGGFEDAVKRQRQKISEETGISIEDIKRYEKMNDEES